MVPRTVLTRSGLISLNATWPVNTVQPRTAVNNAGPMKNGINNAYSNARMPFNKITAANNNNFNKRVNTVNDKNVNPARPNAVVNTARPKAVLSAVKENKGNAVKASTCWVWRPKHKVLDHGNQQQDLKDKVLIDSGCSRHMTGNRSYLTDYEEIDGGFVAFGGNSKGGKITRKGKIRTGKLDFEDVYFVKELKFNLFSVSQMYDKKNSVLFTDTACVVLSPDYKLTDESHVLLKVPRKDNMYSVDLKNVVPQGGLTCLFAKATPDESNLWHRRLGHVNFKTMNKLVKGNLVRGLPSKLFEINQTCVACQKGKQHRASCKSKTISSISQPLQMLHMDLFGLTFVKSLMKKMYCLVVTDDFSRFSWVFFLATKDETSEILKTFITGIENLIDLKVKVIRCDNGTEFKNKIMNQFCEMKGRKPALNFMRPFGYPVTILNTIDHLGNQSNGSTGTKACDNACKSRMETKPGKYYILLPLSIQDPPFSSSSKDSPDSGFKPSREEEKKDAEDPGNKSGNPTEGKDSEVPSTEEPRINQEKVDNINSTNNINTASDGNNTNNVNDVSSTVNVVGSEVNAVDPKTSIELPNDPNMPELKDIGYSDDDEDGGSEAHINNLDTHILVSPILTTIIHKDCHWAIDWVEDEAGMLDWWTGVMGLVLLGSDRRRISSVLEGELAFLLKDEEEELSAIETIQVDCDLKAINIILQGLPSDVYSLVNHHRVAKDLWERVQLLMQGTSLTKQERECKMYDAFDKFAHIKGESLH
ncbi:putative ribonuclease H-like domain-containing protein [Tanacetum coccineum]|uniref:Ribonuclease H-like domain-containing protein n=1 Tax=Tanacetum coccineum TaxID=301880 RepID=A0ABQ4ZQF3_9ASTR